MKGTALAAKKTLILEALGLLSIALLGSCAGTATIKSNNSALIDIRAEIPAPLGAKLRSLSGKTADSPLFDAADTQSALRNKPYVKVLSLSVPGPNIFAGRIEISDIGRALETGGLTKRGVATLEKGSGWTELRVHLTRGQGSSLLQFFPGIDEQLVEALSPPALDTEPMSRADYETMLRSLLGSKAMAGMQAASLELSIAAPGPIIDSDGGSASGQNLRVKIPVLDLLCLEHPITIRLRWKN